MADPLPRRPSGFLAGFLAALVLILVAAAVIGAFVPVVDCPRCNPPWDFFQPFENWDVHKLGEPCKVCDGRKKVTVLKRWMHQHRASRK